MSIVRKIEASRALSRAKARAEAKARYDRFVCAVASGCCADPNSTASAKDMAESALIIMLAADKRWEEYVKGGSDETD